ncbi:hypothetical protein N9M27_05845 [Flavobacteriales bacterium]|nr:hypothetical protein [Flavobacteriales bacterium]
MHAISKPIAFTILFFLPFSFAYSQIISQFTWESGAVGTADIGPTLQALVLAR